LDSGKLCSNADPRLLSTEKISLVKSWLEKHAMNANTDFASLPTRLLNMSDIDQTRIVAYETLRNNDFPSVSESGPAMSLVPVRYVALSHRWGTKRLLATTRANFDKLKDGIDGTSMPKTFKDAVLFARQLDIRYLWIDALCILQDDSEGWLHESQKMGGIFMNVPVTFAIHCAEDDFGGFLDKMLSKRPTLTHNSLTGAVGLCLPPDPDCDVTNSSLSKRGWIVQELFLSRRTIHFTIGKVYLESSEGVLCEDGSLLKESLKQSNNSDDLGIGCVVPMLYRIYVAAWVWVWKTQSHLTLGEPPWNGSISSRCIRNAASQMKPTSSLQLQESHAKCNRS
jgi:hypothetical protein